MDILSRARSVNEHLIPNGDTELDEGGIKCTDSRETMGLYGIYLLGSKHRDED